LFEIRPFNCPFYIITPTTPKWLQISSILSLTEKKEERMKKKKKHDNIIAGKENKNDAPLPFSKYNIDK